MRDGEPFWAFKMDNDMNLIGMNFAEAQALTKGL